MSKAAGVTVATVRDWERSRTDMEPTIRSLLQVVGREPGATPRALAG